VRGAPDVTYVLHRVGGGILPAGRSPAISTIRAEEDADDGKLRWEAIVDGMVMNSTISYAVNGKQYVMVFTGEGQSVTAGPLGLTNSGHGRSTG
jgi:hypothetical protein